MDAGSIGAAVPRRLKNSRGCAAPMRASHMASNAAHIGRFAKAVTTFPVPPDVSAKQRQIVLAPKSRFLIRIPGDNASERPVVGLGNNAILNAVPAATELAPWWSGVVSQEKIPAGARASWESRTSKVPGPVAQKPEVRS